MQISCPHCHNPLSVLSDVALSDIPCPNCGSTFSLVPDETIELDAPKKRLGRFELLERIGHGAFGTVWKARDTELERQVAVKIPRKEELDPAETEKFLREAQAAAQLKHPNIVSVHEVGRQDNRVYLVSDFVDGVTLSDWLTGRQLLPRESAKLCETIASALHHAHENGIVHRDLKPSNIMLDDKSQPHIMDFGLAKRERAEVTVTADGRILGTPAYMSPEQARGEAHESDRRADVYSMGVILFELLTGELPFRGTTRMLLYQVMNEDAPSPRKLNGNVPRDLETICLKCLEKEPGARYATADALAHDLGCFLRNEPIKASPPGTLALAWRWCRRNPAVAMLSSAVAILLLVGTSISIFFATKATERATAAERNLKLAKAQTARADRAAENARIQAERADAIAKQASESAAEAERARREAMWQLKRAEATRRSLMELAAPGFLDGMLDNPAYKFLLQKPIRMAQSMAASAGSQNDIKQILIAMFVYEDLHGHLPPAVIYGPDGQPWHSWRVLLLPYLHEKELYDRYRFNEPWDSEHNSALIEEMPIVYRDALSVDRTGTVIAAITGEGTVFPPVDIRCDGNTKTSDDVEALIEQHKTQLPVLSAIVDNLAHCLMIGTTHPSTDTPWTKPEDVTWHSDLDVPGIEGSFGTPFEGVGGWHGNFGFADGKVRQLPNKMDRDVFHQMLRVDDG